MMGQPPHRRIALAGALAATMLLAAGAACADDQLILSGNGATLSGATGGGGGSLNYLHDMTRGVISAGGEYQKLDTSRWAFGSLSGALLGNAGTARWTVSAEGHFGAGDTDEVVGTHHYGYYVEALGASGTFNNKVTLQLETRQFDIDTTHGNLPKIGLGVLWARSWLTTVSYANSVSGNLGTELVTLRVDKYGRLVNFTAGAAGGHVAPAVVNIQTGALGPAPRYREGYVGFTRRFSRADLGLLGDYLDLTGTHRITLTLTITIHLDRTGA